MGSLSNESSRNAAVGAVVSEAEVRVGYAKVAATYIQRLLGQERSSLGSDGYIVCDTIESSLGQVLVARHTHSAGELLAAMYPDDLQRDDEVSTYYFVKPDGEVYHFEDDMVRDRELEDEGDYQGLVQWRQQKQAHFLGISEAGEESHLRHLNQLLATAQG